jgi:cytochrome c
VAKNGVRGLFLLAFLSALGRPLACVAADPAREDMLKLSADKSCTLCHSMEPRKASASELLPFAPAWKDIARKYRGQHDAEDKLTRIVLGGTSASADGPHWKNKVRDPFMLANTPEISEADARRLVRWILSLG